MRAVVFALLAVSVACGDDTCDDAATPDDARVDAAIDASADAGLDAPPRFGVSCADGATCPDGLRCMNPLTVCSLPCERLDQEVCYRAGAWCLDGRCLYVCDPPKVLECPDGTECRIWDEAVDVCIP